MLPANNKGMGMSFGFPDVCLSPALGPFPFPNFSLNAMKVPFSPNVWFSMLPALNMASFSPVSLGDQLGTLHPTFMGQARHIFGNIRVLINFLPATSLLSPRIGNNFNCPLGAQVIPSLTNVFLTYNAGDGGVHREGAPALDVDAILSSLHPCSGDAPVEHAHFGDGIGYLRIRRFSLDVPSRVHTALASLLAEGLDTLVIDLRDNPGGELTAALELAGDFLPPGTVIARAIDADGDETVHRSRHASPHSMPLCILVDRNTASAAELVAGSLQFHRRAVIAGETTFGKGTALVVRPSPADRNPELAVGATFVLPDGRPIQGVGIEPDVPLAQHA
ncbi:Carboxyl-terminal protease [Minicystis rosea]|nr:Carboxyl-terminal protease [Minicystis rosea]